MCRYQFSDLRDDDRGIGLAEMLVAMVIFALVSTSVLYGMIAMLQLSRESRAMQVATNLAAEEIDLVRDVDDVFAIVDATRSIELNGDIFEVTRTARWVSDPDTDLDCGAGGTPLQYKRVSVDVSWSNMRDIENPVSSYTIVTPRTKINDPAKGTALISALKASGNGSSGVAVTVSPATPPVGAETPDDPSPATDVEGCSFALRLTPGSYQVSLSRAGFISSDQIATPAGTVSIAASSTSSIGFLYDEAARFTVEYASNNPDGGVPALPIPMTTSFVSSYGVHHDEGAVSGGARSLDLFPHSSGYEVIPGTFSEPNESNGGCLAVDPEAWEPLVDGTETLVGERAGPAAAPPGGATAVEVPMGLVDIKRGTGGGRYLRAESVDAGGPGCAVGMSLTFAANVLPANPTTTQRVALPYGSWRLYSGNRVRQNDPIRDILITPVTRGDVGGPLGGFRPGVLTLDPRENPL